MKVFFSNIYIGLFLLVYAPILGNALTYEITNHRRPFQAIIFCLGLFIILNSMSWWGRLKNVCFKDFKIPLLGIFIFYLIAFVVALFQDASITDKAILKLISSSIIFMALILFFLQVRSQKRLHFKSSPKEIASFNTFVLITGILLFIRAWLGPEKDHIIERLNFDGNGIVLGVWSIVICFFILFLNKNIFGVLLSLPYLYLSFFSTSRTAMLLFFFFIAIMLIQNGKIKKRYILIAPLIILIYLGMFSFNLQSRFFPVYIPSDSHAQEIVHVQSKKLWERLNRLPRAFIFLYHSLARHNNQKNAQNIEPTSLFADLEVSLHEPRIILAKDAIKSIRERPWGNYPLMYRSLTKYYKNTTNLYSYPHNLILETGFYFGWPLMILFTYIYSYLLLHFCRQLFPTNDSIHHAISTICIGYLFSMMLTGTYYAYFPFVIITIIYFLFTLDNKPERKNIS